MTVIYKPPFTITPKLLRLVGEIGERIGELSVLSGVSQSPKLRRGNRIRTIQASLAIEQNSLSLEQVTAVLDGKRVLGNAREIREVRNAFAAYENLGKWSPSSSKDLLAAHKMMMEGLVEHPGTFRKGGVGVFKGEKVIHMAPPATRVKHLMDDLMNRLKKSDTHPLISSCIFHYEFEFIHPFADGNGRLGRLWQTLILSHWKPLLGFLPVETVIRDRQDEYYRVLATSDKLGEATPFVEFMLFSIGEALKEVVSSDQVIDHVTDQVKKLLKSLGSKAMSATELMKKLELSHRPTFRQNYLGPALNQKLIEMTQPDSPRSPSQQYRLTETGRAFLKS